MCTHLDLFQLFSDHTADKMWMVGSSPTVADIILSITLARLKMIGFSSQLFENDRMPGVEKYFNMVSHWDTFINVTQHGLPVGKLLAMFILFKVTPVALLGAALVGGYCLYKKYK